LKTNLAMFCGAAALLWMTAASVVHAQPPSVSTGFQDIPLDHWAYSEVDKLQRAGLVVGVEGRLYDLRRVTTRFGFAVAVARALDRVDRAGLPQGGTQLKHDAQVLIALPSLMRLVIEFEPELKLLNMDVPTARARLAALIREQAPAPVGPVNPPFRDMPADHWAFEAVEKLRKLGILSGYPNGTLNGNASRR